LGGVPITLAFVADGSRSNLLAVAAFRAPVPLRPGTALPIRYRARIFGLISGELAYRFARNAFGKIGSRCDALYCRPVLSGLVKPTRRTIYADVSPHFHAHFGPLTLPLWACTAGPQPTEPQLAHNHNSTLAENAPEKYAPSEEVGCLNDYSGSRDGLRLCS